MTTTRFNRRQFQFSLWKLFTWTTLWAVFLSLMQLVGVWFAILLIVYLLALAAIRTELGYEPGSVIAASGTALILSFSVIGIAPMLVIGPLFAVPIGLAVGFGCSLFVHAIAFVGSGKLFGMNQDTEASEQRGRLCEVNPNEQIGSRWGQFRPTVPFVGRLVLKSVAAVDYCGDGSSEESEGGSRDN